MKNKKKQYWGFQYYVILIILLLNSLSGISQRKLNPKELTITGFTQFEFKYVGKDENKYYIVRMGNLNNYYLKAFDLKTDELVYENKIKLPSYYNSTNIIKMKCINDELYILSYSTDNNLDKTFIYIESFNSKTGNQNREFQKIAEMEKTNKEVSFRIAESPSNEIFAVLFIDIKKLEYLNSEIFLFDSEFNLINQVPDCIINIFGSNMIDELIVTDNSEVIIIVKHSLVEGQEAFQTQELTFTTRENFKARVMVYEQNYSYKLLYIPQDSETKTYDILAPPDSFVKYATVSTTGDKICIWGTLSEIDNLNNNEIFCTKFDKYNDIIEINNPFKIDQELVLDNLEEKDKKLYDAAVKSRSDMLWDYHDLNNAGIIKFNNGYLILLEKTATYLQPNQGESVVVGANDYVYLIMTDNNFQIKKLDIIQKNQTQIGDPFYKSAYWVKDGKFYFLSTPLSYLKELDNPNMKLYIYDSDLDCEKITIPSPNDYKSGILSRNIWITDNKFIGYAVKNHFLGTFQLFSVENTY